MTPPLPRRNNLFVVKWMARGWMTPPLEEGPEAPSVAATEPVVKAIEAQVDREKVEDELFEDELDEALDGDT